MQPKILAVCVRYAIADMINQAILKDAYKE
ncbi:hypothetical protein AVU07_agp115 [Escherichia phage phiSUSP1]|uniref:Uncharacterized protein n=1 Tax=Escherichia phage phiSUSP1 TaxID=1718606 RepID=A0A0N9SLB5_9CAUD|nr:hypothetical protein AVU07_agp115 [Escherichia phage phiSUSP1]ALH47006.1 hypothetical protein [Escherichia phage phiSUSP1]